LPNVKKPLWNGENLMLFATTDMPGTMLSKSHAKELQKIPLADSNVRRIVDISEDICDQLTINVQPHVLYYN
jgi:hypothetical protein